jgi:hypothetical protein
MISRDLKAICDLLTAVFALTQHDRAAYRRAPRRRSRTEMTPSAERPERCWMIRLDGFADHTVAAPSKAAARYRDWRAAREAGYFRRPVRTSATTFTACNRWSPSNSLDGSLGL